MDPANILFVIAFIGLPIAFGIWAIASRRELLRSSRPPEQAQEPPQQPERRRAPGPERDNASTQATLQAPATIQQHAPQRAAASQETVQVRATTQQEPPPEQGPPPPPEYEPSQTTGQMPAVQPSQNRPPEPEPDPEPVWSGSSGTTEEFPIIGYPEQAPPDPALVSDQQTAALPVQRTVEPDPPPVIGSPARRTFYPPRYVGRSGGVVKRLTPLEWQWFVAPNPNDERWR